MRTISRLDVPVDASPAYEQFVLRMKAALDKHGTINSYYLHRGSCVFHLTNDPERGQVSFKFEGTALTDRSDQRTRALDLRSELVGETCEWLNESIVAFFKESLRQALLVEFNRYIDAGDLEKTQQRVDELEQQLSDPDTFAGMYL